MGYLSGQRKDHTSISLNKWTQNGLTCTCVYTYTRVCILTIIKKTPSESIQLDLPLGLSYQNILEKFIKISQILFFYS